MAPATGSAHATLAPRSCASPSAARFQSSAYCGPMHPSSVTRPSPTWVMLGEGASLEWLTRAGLRETMQPLKRQKFALKPYLRQGCPFEHETQTLLYPSPRHVQSDWRNPLLVTSKAVGKQLAIAC